MRWKNSLAAAKDSSVIISFFEDLSSKVASLLGESSSSEEFPLVYILYILSTAGVCAKACGKFSDDWDVLLSSFVSHLEFSS